MERLTKKINNEYTWKTCYLDCIPKLGKLEDLEEQIGMPLDVLLSLTPYADIYAICSKGDIELLANTECHIIHCKFVNTDFKDVTLDYLDSCGVIIYPLKEFGKSWFLTYEEPERKLEEMKNGI